MKENSLIKKLQNELDIRNKELQDLIDKQTELEEHINYLSNVKNKEKEEEEVEEEEEEEEEKKPNINIFSSKDSTIKHELQKQVSSNESYEMLGREQLMKELNELR
jgi:hypothetical protein